MNNRDSLMKVLKALLIVAAVGFVVVKIYQKFFKNKSVDMINDLQELEELEMLEEADFNGMKGKNRADSFGKQQNSHLWKH